MKSKYYKTLQIHWIRIFVILTVICFSQIYPYVHIHHSHSDSFLSFDISNHLLDYDIQHAPEHHDDDDHDHTFDIHVARYNLRSHSQSVLSFAKLVYIPHYNVENPNNKNLVGRIRIDNPLEYQFILIDPLDIRGPPISA